MKLEQILAVGWSHENIPDTPPNYVDKQSNQTLDYIKDDRYAPYRKIEGRQMRRGDPGRVRNTGQSPLSIMENSVYLTIVR